MFVYRRLQAELNHLHRIDLTFKTFQSLTILVVYPGRTSRKLDGRSKRGAVVSLHPAVSRVTAPLPGARGQSRSQIDISRRCVEPGAACVQGPESETMFMFVGSRIRNRDVGGIGTGTCDIVKIQGRKIKFLLSKVDIAQKSHREEFVHSLLG